MTSTCDICRWTNIGLTNIGEVGSPKMICQGCVKRMWQCLSTSLDLSEVQEIHEQAARVLGINLLQQKYDQLLYAVARKFPGETRHQTALRYIHEAEGRARSSGQQTEKEGP